ncbi:sorbosone dehydrogenase family protein [Aggregicoccus sp. 17bor-14]|uniref:PQQ-dependent sugar dehydrogenase n=1 Tax=Myxococcaceae TaxID=31 RepID=UPI00129C7F63|nr:MULTISPECIES: sorbosone dehydrogenase family protein [Myxococcaceae]MBF5045754.1 sorbosone dehydrogenase family protein [Simulacricoccus sp. 17bor-14]MRI91489.1 sorbosone dehydrogenase family protein [Aggregicoccus sp. 17bor-14]
MRALLLALLLPASALAHAGHVRTQVLQPQAVHLTLQQLPRPNATRSADKSPDVVAPPKDAVLNVPEGFQVNLYAEGLERPRFMVLTPEGDVLVAESQSNRLTRLRDADGDGVAELREPFADQDNGLTLPFGMAFTRDAFYVANTSGVRRYPYAKGQGRLKGQGTQIASLPGRGYNQHWTRNLRVSPDGKQLFVTVGSETNVDVERAPRAGILVMGLDGSGQRLWASGLRNPVGLDFHPRTGAPYATVNERDELGDDLVPDYLTQVKDGGFYGWPYAYLAPGNLDPRRTKGGKSEAPELAAKTLTPDVLFQAHSAALGLTFYRGQSFPPRYRTGAFVAFRGSWNRGQGTGYKVVYVPFTPEGRPEGGYEDFLTGFLLDPNGSNGPTTWARPVGLLELPDGSLLLSEDGNGRIYRVSAKPAKER